MNLYLISQEANNDYDTYDSAVVVAKTPKEAKAVHPNGKRVNNQDYMTNYTWVGIDDVKVKFIGTTKRKKKGVICASFNAG